MDVRDKYEDHDQSIMKLHDYTMGPSTYWQATNFSLRCAATSTLGFQHSCLCHYGWTKYEKRCSKRQWRVSRQAVAELRKNSWAGQTNK